MKSKIRVGDEVEVIAGNDRGKKGTVISLDIVKRKIRVQNVRIQTRHDKKEGIQKGEGFIDFSNVKFVKKGEVKKSSSQSQKPSVQKKKKIGFFNK